jgi:hypothetical protein
MIPVLTAAGRKVIKTLSPVCKPTPVARMTFLRVLCLIIVVGTRAAYSAEYYHKRGDQQTFFRYFANICCELTTI